MRSIYKTAIIIGYRQAFVDWFSQTQDKHSLGKRIDLSELNKKPLIIFMELLPKEEDFYFRLEAIKVELFCFVMNEWCNDESFWHHEISEKEFDRFFDIRKTESVFDLEDKMESFSLGFGLKESYLKLKKLKK